MEKTSTVKHPTVSVNQPIEEDSNTRQHEASGNRDNIKQESSDTTKGNPVGVDNTDIPFFRHENGSDTATLCKTWLFLNQPTSSRGAKLWLMIYLGVVVLNTFIIVTWPEFRVPPYMLKPKPEFFNSSNVQNFLQGAPEKVKNLVETDHHPVLFVLDIACLIFFIAETAIHFWACPNKRTYHKVPEQVMKSFLCISMVITVILDINKYNPAVFNPAVVTFYTFIRSISIMRLTLILQLRKLYKKLDILLLSIERSSKELILLLFVLLVLVLIYGTMMFSAEIQSNSFPNNWVALWWSIITMTTVGYGDFYPTTGLGYVIGTLCALNGLIVLALPIASIASNFSNFSSKQDYIHNHQAMIQTQNQQRKQDKVKMLK